MILGLTVCAFVPRSRDRFGKGRLGVFGYMVTIGIIAVAGMYVN